MEGQLALHAAERGGGGGRGEGEGRGRGAIWLAEQQLGKLPLETAAQQQLISKGGRVDEHLTCTKGEIKQ